MKCFGRNGLEGTKKPNIKSGFPELDKITNGWNNGRLDCYCCSSMQWESQPLECLY